MTRTLGALALAVGASCAMAQVETVVVTATRAPRAGLDVPASVDRIEGEEIREGRFQVNLSESLGRVPGIAALNRQNYAQDLQIQSRGFGARSTFGVRGIRLIADGIPATMPDGQGQAATFALGSAGSIEVLRGPFSALYGNSAGGVIAIETMDAPPAPTIEASGFAGSYGTWRTGARAGGQWGTVNALADVSRFHTDGYRPHSSATREHLNARLRAGGLTIVANSLRQPDTEDPLGLSRTQFESDPRQTTAEALAFNTRKSVSQDQLGVRWKGRAVEAMLYVGQRGVQQFLAIPLAAQAPATHSGGVIDLDRNYGGGALRWSGEFGALRVSAGAEHDAMYERRRGFFNNNGEQGALKRDEDNSVGATDAYVQAEWNPAERWSLHAGARHSRVAFRSTDYYTVANADDSGSRTYRATTPVAGILYRLAERTSLYANAGRGFETPTFLELAYRSAGSGLNFDLEASASRHAELGLKSAHPGLGRLNVALFSAVTSSEIVVERNQGGRATFKNVGHTDRKGVEVGVQSSLRGPVQAALAYTRLDATFREGFTTVIATFPNNAPVPVPAGAALPGVARDQLYAELRYRRPGVYATLEGLYRSRVPVNDPNTDFTPSSTAWNLVAGLEQEIGRWRLGQFLRLDNLTDRSYVGSVIVNETSFRYFEPAPGRAWSIGLQTSYRL